VIVNNGLRAIRENPIVLFVTKVDPVFFRKQGIGERKGED
jgi:hypothetical protein